MEKLSYFFILLLVGMSQSATGGIADIDITWKATAVDQNQRTPIEGVTFLFNLTDKANGKVWEKTCISNSQGECEVVARADRGFFSGANMEAAVRFEKPGYSQKALSKWNGNAVTFWMTSEERLQAEADDRSRKIREEASERAELIRRLDEAEKESSFLCENRKQCDKVFSLAEIYIGQTSDMKIQLVTTNTIETYNPTEYFKIGLSANRIPSKGDSSLVVLRTACKDVESPLANNVCLTKKLQATRGFASFVATILKE